VTLLAPASRAGIRLSGQRVAAGAVAALALANLHVPGRPATLCPFRALTGIPCPFCGGTTAAVHLGRFDLLGALRANPVIVFGAVVVAAMPAVIAFRSSRHGARWPALSSTTIRVAIALALVFSEVWQLFRFGIL
jgi:predicted ABC-type sugar transport system permease subunit